MWYDDGTMKTPQRAFKGIARCLVEGCDAVFCDDPKSTRALGSTFSAHLQHVHHIRAEDYTVRYIYGGIRPHCVAPDCLNATRYVNYEYKRFCKDHARMAMSEAGRFGGTAPNPMKGKTKEDDARLAQMSERMQGVDNHFYGRKHSDETRAQISAARRLQVDVVETRLSDRQSEWTMMTPIDAYERRQGQYLEFKCITCETVSHMTLQAFERGSLCKTCYKSQVSRAQRDIADWIEAASGIRPELSTKRVISPKELDVYVESANVAVEYHGLYFHSTAKDDDIDRHVMLDKHRQCAARGIRLQQFFADEWRDKRPICESMLRHALSLTLIKLNARACDLVELTKQEAREFFMANHIDGHTGARKCFALRHDGVIVIALSLRKPQGRGVRRDGAIEIARSASKLGHHVRGGVSRLVSAAAEWARQNGFTSMLTYADLRFGVGGSYAQAGFRLVGHTGIGRCWTDLTRRYNRQSCKADRERGLTEAQHAAELGWHTIWTPGSNVYVMGL